MSLKIINIDTPTLGDRSYIAHDGKTALVVDPQRDIDRVEEIIKDENLHIGAVLETHMHNDYVSGGLVLARKYGVKYQPTTNVIVMHVSFDDRSNVQILGLNDFLNPIDIALWVNHECGFPIMGNVGTIP